MTERKMPAIGDFPHTTTDKVRFRDMDRQGHVNNAVFSTYFETGRAEIFYDPKAPLNGEGECFVIAKIVVEYLGEILWPGEVTSGTRISRIGNSSVTVEQALFQNGACVAWSESVLVQINEATRRSAPLSKRAVDELEKLMKN